ncbi:adenylate cyclase type 10-like [Larus michahellis]|uniref:adenylate cyclase type 10-like n=1 Tax=Larus michahellis TaxID=119627 RepID=UPI003D9BC1EA
MFCGVTGHPLRHEYTVLGQKVNLAARMMVHYPGLVSCDAVTYAASRLPASYFKELPEREMKGLRQPGPVYQYVGVTEESIFGVGLTKKRSEYVPLLGRKQETDLFVSCLNAYRDSGQRNILAVEGTMGCGKSHLLAELASLGQDAGHRVVALELLEIDTRQPFSAIRMLMARALGLQDCESRGDRQRVLKTKLQGTIEESSYCLLNDIFGVKFPISDNVREMDETQRRLELHSTRVKVLEKTLTGDFGIFVIDNAHFIDPDSWFIMSPVLQKVSLFMVMSLAPGYEITESFRKAAADNATSQKITYLHLDKLKASVVMQKVCKDLGVVSIPRDLVRFLIRTSSGIPYYCEELLRCLRANDMLQFCTRRQSGKAKDNWESLITSAAEASSLAATWSSEARNDGRVCLLRPGVTLENTALPIPLKGKEPSAALPAVGCAGAPSRGTGWREAGHPCAAESPSQRGGSAGKAAPVPPETGLGLQAAAFPSCEPAGCSPSAGRREKVIRATLKWLPFLTKTNTLLGKGFDLPLSQL